MLVGQPGPAHVLRLRDLAAGDLRLRTRRRRSDEPLERDADDQNEDDARQKHGQHATVADRRSRLESQRRISRRGPIKKDGTGGDDRRPCAIARSSASSDRATTSTVGANRWPRPQAPRPASPAEWVQSCRRSFAQRSECREHPGDVLVAHRAKKQRDAGPSNVLQMRRQSAGAGRVMRGIEQDLDAARARNVRAARATRASVSPLRSRRPEP